MWKKSWAIVAVGSLLLLTACPGQTPTTTTSPAPTLIAALGEALTAADQAAIAYVQLPLCPTGAALAPNGTLCSQASISAKIKSAAATAYAAYKLAEASPTTASLVTAAEQALATYTGLIPATK